MCTWKPAVSSARNLMGRNDKLKFPECKIKRTESAKRRYRQPERAKDKQHLACFSSPRQVEDVRNRGSKTLNNTKTFWHTRSSASFWWKLQGSTNCCSGRVHVIFHRPGRSIRHASTTQNRYLINLTEAADEAKAADGQEADGPGYCQEA